MPRKAFTIVLPTIAPPVVPVGAMARPSAVFWLLIVKPAPTPPSVTPSAVNRTVSPVAATPVRKVEPAPEKDFTVRFALVMSSASS